MTYRSLAICALLFSSLSLAQQTHHHSISPLTYALRIGRDFSGESFYLCQVQLFNRSLPGKTKAGYGFCSVPYKGNEYLVKQFDIPTRDVFGRISWNRDLDGAIILGRGIDAKPLFLCQSAFNGSMQPGITWPGSTYCAIAINGREIMTDNYRVLSAKNRLIIRSYPAASTYYHQDLLYNRPYR